MSSVSSQQQQQQQQQHDTAAISPGTSHLILEGNATETKSIQLVPTPSADPNEPLNWSKKRKFINYTLVLSVTLVIFTALSNQVVFWQLLITDLDVDFNQLNNSQSINSAGLTVGCVFFIHFAIKYGRRPIYIISTAVIFAMSVWSARMTTVWELYVTNLFMGLAGATNEAIVGLTVADLFFVHQRGTMNGLYLVMVMLGSYLTPLIAGVQATAQGWRWSYYILSIATGLILVLFIFFYEETKYIPIFDSREITGSSSTSAEHTQKDSGKESSSATEVNVSADVDRSQHMNDSIPLKSWKQRLALVTPTDESLWKVGYRPVVVLFSFPDVAFAAIQYAAGLTWLINSAVVVSIVFSYPPYSMNPMGIGLMGLGPLIGNILGSIYCGYLADKAVVWFAKRNHGWHEPEMRLYLLHLPSLTISTGLIMFGITTAKSMHWIYPSIGLALFGFGLGSFGDTVLTYVIDSHRLITGEAFVGMAFVRNVFGIVIGEVRTQWMTKMGVQNMFILQGVVGFAIAILYIPMIYFGKRARIATAAKYYKLSERRM